VIKCLNGDLHDIHMKCVIESTPTSDNLMSDNLRMLVEILERLLPANIEVYSDLTEEDINEVSSVCGNATCALYFLAALQAGSGTIKVTPGIVKSPPENDSGSQTHAHSESDPGMLQSVRIFTHGR
jgi:hypothetical protein